MSDLAARAGWPSEFGERALPNAFYDRWVGHEDRLAGDDEAATTVARARDVEDLDVVCVDAGQGVWVCCSASARQPRRWESWPGPPSCYAGQCVVAGRLFEQGSSSATQRDRGSDC